MITLVRRSLRRAQRGLRAATIRRLEADIDWARASSDAHIAALERQIAELRAQQDARTAQDIARDMAKRDKRFA